MCAKKSIILTDAFRVHGSGSLSLFAGLLTLPFFREGGENVLICAHMSRLHSSSAYGVHGSDFMFPVAGFLIRTHQRSRYARICGDSCTPYLMLFGVMASLRFSILRDMFHSWSIGGYWLTLSVIYPLKGPVHAKRLKPHCIQLTYLEKRMLD